jgi:glutathione S-transferase
MAAPVIECYTVDVSICSQIARLAIEEHGLKAKHVNVDIEEKMENYEPWYARINPKLTVPTVVYDGQKITDSQDIMKHLAKNHPERKLYDAGSKAHIDVYMKHFYDSFSSIGGFTFLNIMKWGPHWFLFIMKGKGLVTWWKQRQLAKDPEFTKIVEDKRIAISKMKNSGKSLAEMEAAVKSICDRMEEDLSKSKSGFLVGDHYTLADVMATALCARVHFIKGMAYFGPHTEKYFEMVQKRPSYKEAKIVDCMDKAAMGEQAQWFFIVLGSVTAAVVGAVWWRFFA